MSSPSNSVLSRTSSSMNSSRQSQSYIARMSVTLSKLMISMCLWICGRLTGLHPEIQSHYTQCQRTNPVPSKVRRC